jgi:hypothetical protein
VAVLISTNPPGLADSSESMKDGGRRSASDEEVPLIMILNVGHSRSWAERGRVDAGVMYVLGDSTSAEMERGTSDMEGVEGINQHPGRGNRDGSRVVNGSGVGIDDIATAEGESDCRRGWNRV